MKTFAPNIPVMRLCGHSLLSNRLTPLLSLLVPLCFVLLIISAAPLGTALEFGTDEGYELMKGFLLGRGFALYDEIWSDQPPLHTALLAFLFKLFGPSALAARLLSVAALRPADHLYHAACRVGVAVCQFPVGGLSE